MAMLHAVPVLVGEARSQRAGVHMHFLRVTAHMGSALLPGEALLVEMSSVEVLEEVPLEEVGVLL
jgi:hypothetical protein